jgi:uncharacterized membrane protein YraQ (UPF0718 family)
MHWLTDLLTHTLDLSLEAAPWLLLGLIVAGLLKAYLPDALLQRWIGGRGFWSITRAAIVGAPLPLCSCGVMPAAIGLRRQGASSGSTVSFLVATPETGVDSVAVSYALLGPVLTIVRPIAAIISAIVSGLTCQFVASRWLPHPGPVGGGAPASGATQNENKDCCQSSASTACCETKETSDAEKEANPSDWDDQSKASLSLAGDDSKQQAEASCCDATGQCAADDNNDVAPPVGRLRSGLRYAARDLMDEIWVWMLVGLVAAGLVRTFLDPSTLGSWGSGLPMMLLMLVIGIPMYICATASTPLAAALLLGGLSPGSVLVFLLAGPASNVATLGLVRRELGTPVLVSYLLSMAVVTLALGLATDALINLWQLNVAAQIGQATKAIPLWLAWASLILLVLVAIRPLRQRVL